MGVEDRFVESIMGARGVIGVGVRVACSCGWGVYANEAVAVFGYFPFIVISEVVGFGRAGGEGGVQEERQGRRAYHQYE